MFEGVGRRSNRSSGYFMNLGQNSLSGYERNVLFRNEGDGTFVDVGWVNQADCVEDGRGLAVLDFDRDGRQDLILRNYRQPAVLLRNTGAVRHWISLELVGGESNRDAIGARIRLRANGSWQTRVVAAGSGYLSASSRRQHFGLGSAERAELVEIRWPSGATSELADLAADRSYRVVEGVGVQ